MSTYNRNEALVYILEHVEAKMIRGQEVWRGGNIMLEVLFSDAAGEFEVIIFESELCVELIQRVKNIRRHRVLTHA